MSFITCINVCYHQPKKLWQCEIHSSDGTVWGLDEGCKEYAIERAETFACFSGLPVFVHGEPWVIPDAKPIEPFTLLLCDKCGRLTREDELCICHDEEPSDA